MIDEKGSVSPGATGGARKSKNSQTLYHHQHHHHHQLHHQPRDRNPRLTTTTTNTTTITTTTTSTTTSTATSTSTLITSTPLPNDTISHRSRYSNQIQMKLNRASNNKLNKSKLSFKTKKHNKSKRSLFSSHCHLANSINSSTTTRSHDANNNNNYDYDYQCSIGRKKLPPNLISMYKPFSCTLSHQAEEMVGQSERQLQQQEAIDLSMHNTRSRLIGSETVASNKPLSMMLYKPISTDLLSCHSSTVNKYTTDASIYTTNNTLAITSTTTTTTPTPTTTTNVNILPQRYLNTSLSMKEIGLNLSSSINEKIQNYGGYIIYLNNFTSPVTLYNK
ncbi:unnamed protein product [Schistosoma turkestanicum]|nr:unnamed protein product [Schistosoma turkestanicum]